MDGELERSQAGDPTRLRISDTEREQVAEILRQAAGDGRIDLAELDERLEAAYAARTYADLVPITHDLPGQRHQVPARAADSAPPVSGPDHQRHLAIMSSLDRSGVWRVPQQLTVLALMGGANLDLRQATFAAPEVVLTINAFMGGATVIIGPHQNVVIEGVAIMGGYSGPSGLVDPELDETSPTVRIKGIAIWGGVNVERKHVKPR
ncbi:MAG: DUF1707 domain-containing protein [Nocardioides sp.]